MGRSLLLALLILVSGCTSAPGRPVTGDLTPRDVLAGTPIIGTHAPALLPAEDLLALDQPMRAFLARHIDMSAGATQRLEQLVTALDDERSFGLRYTDATRTAPETFRSRDGNCLALTNLFVALARGARLDVSYQEVDIAPDWQMQGDLFLFYRHINAVVDLGTAGRRTVDFSSEQPTRSENPRRVSDARAQAHYHSNLAVALMQADDLGNAFLSLRRGLQADDSFSPLWTNLGALYLRVDATAHAEASYLEALRRRRTDMVAISGLARVYERIGDERRAAHYHELAASFRNENPFFRVQQARTELLAGNPERALRHLDFAIARRPGDASFLRLRASVLLQLGDTERARADLQQAAAIARAEQIPVASHPARDGADEDPLTGTGYSSCNRDSRASFSAQSRFTHC